MKFCLPKRGPFDLQNCKAYLLWAFMFGINATYSVKYHKRAKDAVQKRITTDSILQLKTWIIFCIPLSESLYLSRAG